MPKVNSTIKKILKEKDAGILTGTEAMNGILVDLQKQVQGELGGAALGSWDAYQLKRMLDAIERQTADFQTKAKKEIGTSLDASWETGRALIEESLKVAGIYTGFNISTSSLNALKDFTFHKIDGLADDAWYKIKGELTLGVLGGKTPAEVANAIGKNLTDKSIFSSISARAEAITKTEMGRVFSTATQSRMAEAAQYVEGLEKQWIHAGHPKAARPTHVAAAGQHVPWNEPFLIGSIPMMFPRDPKAPIGEVINCGCDHVPWHESWQ